METKPSDELYCNVDEAKINSASPRLNEENLKNFYEWFSERYKIHLKKDVEKIEKPWTTNQVLQKYKFTNVRREHDRESKWLIENICLSENLSYENKLLNIILFRLFNKSESIKRIGLIDFDSEIDYGAISGRLEDHKKVFFSNAFYMSGPKSVANKLFGDKEKLPIKIIRLVQHYRDLGIVDKVRNCKTQLEVFESLKTLPGIGDFLAYQIFVDFTYIGEFPFSENEFTVAGPGCIRGLKLLFDDFDELNYEEALFWLRDNQNIIFEKFGYNPEELFSDLDEKDRHLNLMSLENCMCELSKYVRALNGTGRPKIRYPGI